MEQFIAAVRQHPCLWDVTQRDYRNPEKKEAAWRLIVNLRLAPIRNVSEAKAEWKKLRDNHRDSLKRTQAAGNEKNNWRYADLMEFLLPFMKQRKRNRYINPFDEELSLNRDDFDDEYYYEQSLHTPTDGTLNYTLECGGGGGVNLEEIEPSQSVEDLELKDLLKQIKETQRNRQEERQALEELRKKQEKHPMDLFLESMAMSIKAMPQWMQIKVKRKIFTTVSEAEDELKYSSPSTADERSDNIDADAAAARSASKVEKLN